MLRRMPLIVFASVMVALALDMAVAQEGRKETTAEIYDPSTQNPEAGQAVAVGAYGAQTPELDADLDMTTTTTGKRAAEGDANGSSVPVQQKRENTGD